MATYDDVLDERSWAARTQQEQDLANIEAYYGLHLRFGIRIAAGGRIRDSEREGTIVGTADAHLKVLWDGSDQPSATHATSNKSYLTPTGWVQVHRRSDPCPAGFAA